MSINIKRTIPLVITGLLGLLMITEGFIISSDIASLASITRDWGVIIVSFSLILGGMNVIRNHGSRVAKRTPRWEYSVLVLIAMFVYMALGLSLTMTSEIYSWLYDSINLPMGLALGSLLAPYLFSASVRAFQARNLDAKIFLACAGIVLIGNIPSVYTISPLLAAIGPWLTEVPMKGAFTGLLMTAAIGSMIVAIRTLLGRESAYLGGE